MTKKSYFIEWRYLYVVLCIWWIKMFLLFKKFSVIHRKFFLHYTYIYNWQSHARVYMANYMLYNNIRIFIYKIVYKWKIYTFYIYHIGLTETRCTELPFISKNNIWSAKSCSRNLISFNITTIHLYIN